MATSLDVNISGLHWTNSPGLTTHVMAAAHFVQKNTMDKLTSSNRYPKLSLAYEGYMAQLGEADRSPGELAKELGVSKQACSKTIKEMEELGLLERRKNARDSRSRILSLTPKGLRLLYDGIEATAEIQQEFADKLGGERLDKLIQILEKLCRNLAVDLPHYRVLDPASGKSVSPTRLNLLLHTLSNLFYHSLIDALSDKGFEGLKSNFSQVLALIVPEGGRIQHISSVIGVSKQAVSVIASEIEQLGYIVRQPDPRDRRQIILRLSSKGEQLLSESASSVQSLEASIRDMLSDEEYRHLEDTMATLYSDVIDHYDPSRPSDKIQKISQSLLKDLGVEGVRTLAQQLMIMTRGTI